MHHVDVSMTEARLAVYHRVTGQEVTGRSSTLGPKKDAGLWPDGLGHSGFENNFKGSHNEFTLF